MSTLLRGVTLWTTERRLVRRTIEQTSFGRQLAGRFVAGDTLEDGMAAARALSGRHIAAMLDYLGENVRSAAQAAAAAEAYIRALKRIQESPELGTNISVKLTQLGLDSSLELSEENLEHVLEAASGQQPPTLVMIDMEAGEYVDRTLQIYLRLRQRYANLGVCLQAYLYRSANDAAAIAGPAAIVRMAKGAYLEPPEVAYRTRREVRQSFGRLSATLLASGATVHFATHDPRVVDAARRFVRARSISRTRYEFQMLYGIRRDLQGDLVAHGEPVRVYVPYGTEWYPYLTRRLAERPANIWFFVSNLLRMGG
ncbi:MAG: proline dehydrogenase family protein [Actinomycetota bacterium]